MVKQQVQSTLDEQVEKFKREFEIFAAYNSDMEDLLTAKSIELDRQATKWDLTYAETAPLDRKYHPAHRWNWDENWDGKLLTALYGLEGAGFRVVDFTRALKIRLAGYSGLTQSELFSKIHDVVGDIANIKFTRGGIWVQLEKPKRIKSTKSNLSTT